MDKGAAAPSQLTCRTEVTQRHSPEDIKEGLGIYIRDDDFRTLSQATVEHCVERRTTSSQHVLVGRYTALLRSNNDIHVSHEIII